MEINLGMLIALGIPCLLIAVIGLVSMWKVFQKAGEHGWACIVPLYNIYVYYKIIWGSGWKLFLMLIPIYNIIFSIQTIFRLAKVFGKGVGFGFGLWCLNPFFMIILAFGQAEYQGALVNRPAQPQYNPAQMPAGYRPAPAQPAPVQTEPVPAQPAPVQPEPVPAQPAPVQPEPVPAQPAPVQPEPAPAQPAPVQPEPVPAQPAPVQPEPVPAQPAPVSKGTPPVAEEEWIVCKNCGEKIKKSAKFCTNCGQKQS